MTDSVGKVEAPQLSREDRIASEYLNRHKIERPEDLEAASEAQEADFPGLVAEAYDLFSEKQELNEYLVKQQKKSDSGSEKPTLTLDEKRELIRSGRGLQILDGSSDSGTDFMEQTRDRKKEIEDRLDEVFSKPGIYDEFHKDLSRQIKIRHQAREVRNLQRLIDQFDVDTTRIARTAKVQRRSITSIEERSVSESAVLKNEAQERIDELVKNQEVVDQLRILELREYSRQLKSNGFVETPSRRRYVGLLEKLWSQNRKVLVTGATGTGKTQLVRHASRKFFGTKPFEITGHRDMTPYELLGRTGMTVKKGEGSDVYRPSKLIQAMTDKEGDEVEGAPFLYDEIDASPNEANIALKTILNDGPGDAVSVQMDSQEKFMIGPNYSFTGTANVKSEKHSSRFEIDPAIVRVMEPMVLPYIPPQEVWDIVIASQMDRKGELHMTKQEALVTLKNLVDASYWTQQAYLGETVFLDEDSDNFLEARGDATTGKWATLEEAVMDPGRVIKMLEGWDAARLSGQSLEEFIDDQLVRFINNENFPEDDRYYLVKIFALKGFLGSKSVNDFNVGDVDDDTLSELIGTRKSSEKDKRDISNISAKDVARLDPYGIQKGSVSQDTIELLGDELDEPSDSISIAERTDKMLDRAGELLEDDFLGAEAIKAMEEKLRLIGVDVIFPLDKIPPFPYTEKDLQYAKENGEMVTLRPGKMIFNGKDTPITINNLHLLFFQDPLGQLETVIRDDTKITPKPITKKSFLWGTWEEMPPPGKPPWWLNSKFAHEELEPRWSLISRDLMPGSEGKYFDSVFESEIPQLNNELRRLGCTEGVEAPAAVELVWDILLRYMNTGDRMLADKVSYTQTSMYHQGLSKVSLGYFFRNSGLQIFETDPYFRDYFHKSDYLKNTGMVYSR